MSMLDKIGGNKKRAVVTGVAALSTLSLLSFGAYSFFTDQGTITNDFTTGRVDIQESETSWDPEEIGPDGQKDGDNIYPGYTRFKNPMVQNTAGIMNNDSWIKATIRFVDQNGNQITDSKRDELIYYTLRYDKAAVVDGKFDESKATLTESDGQGSGKYNKEQIEALENVDSTLWKIAENESETGKHVFYLNETLKSAATKDAGQCVTLFTHIALPTEWTQDELDIMGDYHIEVTFDGIQQKGFANVDEAMEALNAEANRHEDYVQDDTNRNEDRLKQEGDNSGRGDTSFKSEHQLSSEKNQGNSGDNTDGDQSGDEQKPGDGEDKDDTTGGDEQKPGDDQKPEGGDNAGDEQKPDDGEDKDNAAGGEEQKPEGGDQSGEEQKPAE